MLDDDLDEIHPLFAGAPSTTEFKKLRKRIVRYAREAIDQYGMVERRADGSTPVDLAIPTFGYKSHISIDRQNGIIRRQIITDAARHDGARLREGLVQTANTGRKVWADTVYRSAQNEAWLAANGMVREIHRIEAPRAPHVETQVQGKGPKVGRPVQGRARFRPAEGSDGAGHSDHRSGARQSRNHDGQYGLQHGPIAVASQPSCARLTPNVPVR